MISPTDDPKPARRRRLPLLSPPKTRRALLRERIRCDRRGGEFCALVWDLSALNSPISRRRQVVRLAKRLRRTDVLGQSDERRLIAILPDTGVAGARQLAEELARRNVGDEPGHRPTVCYYTSDWDAELEHPPEATSEDGHETYHVAWMEPLLVRPLPRWKRLFDIAAAGAGLLLLSPILTLTALGVKLTSPGPIFFRQARHGAGGRPFQIVKFRSMVTDAEARRQDLLDGNERDGHAFKIKNDPRITWFGRLIRATSLDELPQLWNVLRGEMSLVGPRPLPCHESAACRGWHRRRLEVTPGLTCVWQISGRDVTWEQWMRMDAGYIKELSPTKDFRILLATVPAVLTAQGSH